MKILASRRLAQKTNMEKVTHYQKMLQKVKHRLHLLDPESAPLTTQRHVNRAIRLEKRILKLQNNHRH